MLTPRKSQRNRFEARFAPEPIEIVILTGESGTTAFRARGDSLYTASQEFLAYIDDRGDLHEVGDSVSWLADESERGGWIHDLRGFTQYQLRVRRALPPTAEDIRRRAELGVTTPPPTNEHRFMLVEVLRRDLRIEALDAVETVYRTPKTMQVAGRELLLDRRFSPHQYEGTVDWLGNEVRLSLECDDDDADTAVTAAKALDAMLADAAGWDARIRDYAARELADLATDWSEDGVPVTPDDFARRVRPTDLSIDRDGDVTFHLDDDGMFAGHSIEVSGDVDGSLTEASIAG
ncbi:DUF2262 domain-containing protein [Corynebacterium hansenii]|uniref:DUF2262 domain-containing protein n=1 Tax=Corynebacterium hansenii TaxID=394964 RepID=A0ABV7ZT66_9CORY|nr:DUF2262 domain-containing protein [Corynebacterium hansenii]WJZ01187.1 hypothetical protein CHAN_13020 [Corynebacterium hansenii]